ncbi:MAG: hypothetical protein IT269_05525 [Saprospiraceae bacterium]|nr:hypothetical protein [Saprospiraceae bacterium]
MEKWPFHQGKKIIDAANQFKSNAHNRLKHQQNNPSLRSVRIDGNELEYFIFEDDNSANTGLFLKKVSGKELDFDYTTIRIPKGFREVKYTLDANGLIDQFDTEPNSPPSKEGFLGTLLHNFREKGKNVPPFVHKESLFHHCDIKATPQSRLRDCPTLMSYGFDTKEGQSNFGKLKIFHSPGKEEKTANGSTINYLGNLAYTDDPSQDDTLNKVFRIVNNDTTQHPGFYFIPLLLPEKEVIYAVFLNHESVKTHINDTFFTGITDARKNGGALIFVETLYPMLRDDDLSILFKWAYNPGGTNNPDNFNGTPFEPELMKIEVCTQNEAQNWIPKRSKKS